MLYDISTHAQCVFSLLRILDKQPVLRMSIGSEFQTLGGAAGTQNAQLAVSKVCVLGTNRRRALVDGIVF